MAMIKTCKMPDLQTKSASGAVATFNTALAMPLKSCVVDFEDEIGIDSLDFSATGKNLWGGEGILHSFQKYNLSGFTYDDEKFTFSAPSVAIRPTLITDIFKPNTQYTLILVGYKNVMESLVNLHIIYTNNEKADLRFATPANKKQTIIYTSEANKSIQKIVGVNGSGNTTLYYNECALLEGVKTADDFIPFGDNKLFSFGKTIQNGLLNVLTGELTNNDTTPPEVINLGGMDISTLRGENNIWADTGNTSLTYKDLDIAKRGNFREVFRLP